MNTVLTIEQDEASSKLLALGVSLREVLATAQSGLVLFFLWVTFYVLFRLIMIDIRKNLQQEIIIKATNYTYFKKKQQKIQELLKEPQLSTANNIHDLPAWQQWLIKKLLNEIENLIGFTQLYKQKIDSALLIADHEATNRIADLLQANQQLIIVPNYHFNPHLLVGRLEVAETAEDIISQITK